MFRTLAIASLLVLSACSSPSQTAPESDHPANAGAPTAPAHDHAGHHHGDEGQGAAATPPAPAQAGALYMCPMHPKVTSNDPEARCPECGMKINKPIPKEQR